MTSFFWSTATGATGATARKEFSYDVILFGVPCYWLLQVLQVLQLARSSSMTSFFWSTLLLVATGATARKEFIYDVILLKYLATGCCRCYRCYSSQGVLL